MSEEHSFQHVIVVHGGAGYHVKLSEKRVKEGLQRACTTAFMGSNTPDSVGLEGLVLQSTVDAIKILENDEIFNAGYGSNLTYEGDVECDASLMTSSSHFGAVGAISGVRNPVEAASAVLQYSKTPDPFGRVSPLLLVSRGAREFAQTTAKCHLIEPETMVSERARAEWQHWRQVIEGTGSSKDGPPPPMQDTVGALTLCRSPVGQVLTSAGVSSGGILMKLSGRVGEAATFGAGCWASPRVAVSVSGTGEQIMRSNLAQALGQAVTRCFEPGSDLDAHAAISTVMTSEFQDACKAMGDGEANAGAIVLVDEEEDVDGAPFRLRLYVVFTTESMAVGWFSRVMKKPQVKIVRQQQRVDGSGVGGRSVCIEAFTIEA